MNLCDEISDAKFASGILAKNLAVASTFGNDTDEMLFNLVRMNALIRVMDRNQTTTKIVKANSVNMQGQTVPVSALTKRNNTLILDLSEQPCLEIEVRPCLSDIEICKVAEVSKKLSHEV